MIKLILRVIINTVAIWIAAILVPTLESVLRHAIRAHCHSTGRYPRSSQVQHLDPDRRLRFAFQPDRC